MWEYCSSKKPLYDRSGIGWSELIEIEDGELCVDFDYQWSGGRTSLEINFCPMCGQPLRGEE